MKLKIDWFGVGFLTLFLSIITLFWLELDNAISCIETYNYSVFLCDINLRLILLVILMFIWFCWALYNLIMITCFEPILDEENET